MNRDKIFGNFFGLKALSFTLAGLFVLLTAMVGSTNGKTEGLFFQEQKPFEFLKGMKEEVNEGPPEFIIGSGSEVIAAPVTIGVCDTAGPIEVESTGGTTTPTAYATLKDAFDAINAGTHTGSINIDVCGNTTETASASLDASGTGSSSYTDVTIRPVGGERIIQGTITGAVIKLNGADNVTIDGRQGGVGTARELTVRNNSTAGATAAIWLASVAVGNGASNNIVRNLEIAAGQTANTGTSVTIGLFMGGTTVSLTATTGNDNDSNSFIANRITKARYGIATRGVNTNNNEGLVITDNIVGPTSFGPDEIGKAGIYLQGDAGAIVSRNTVRFVGGDVANTTAGTDRCGICIGNENWGVTESNTFTSGEYTVTNNIVHDVVEERTFSAAGIRIGTTRGAGNPTNNLVANNFVYNIRANGTSGDQSVGIGYVSGHTDRIVNNSISMTGDVDPGVATASATFGSAIRISQPNGTTHANLTMMNNSIYLDLSSSSTAALRFYAITINSAAYAFGTGGLNYNNYYGDPANTQLQTGGLGTNTGNSITTQFDLLADWQAALTTPQDANSVQANPLYFSNTADPHIQQASPNVDAGTTIAGITDDIDGQARPNGANFDIGADEFYPSPGSVQLSAASYTVSESAGTLTVTVTRAGGANGAASVDYATGGSGATGGAACTAGVDYITTLGTLIWADLDVAPKTFDIPICADGVLEGTETFNLALANAITATLGTPSAAVVSITDAGSTIPGSINVGTGETITSLTNPGGMFDSINTGIVTGNITINITSDLTGESGSVPLNEIAGGFTVLIKPEGSARSITGSGTGVSVIKLNDADNVTIDGSLSGGTDRSLSITNTNPAANTAVIWLANAVNGAQNNTIKNVNIAAGFDQTTGSVFNFGIISSSSAAILTGGADNDNNTYDNNFIRRVSVGLLSIGGFAANPNQNTTISNNLIGPDAFGPDQISTLGILLFNENAPSVVDNEIRFIGEAANSGGSAGRDHVGISLCTGNAAWSGTSAPTIVGNVTNANISRNLIHDIVERATFSAVGIVNNCPNAAPTNNVIANNMIYNILANGTSGDQTVGIAISNGNGDTVAYNSVYLTGDIDPTGATSSSTSSFGISVAFANPQNLTLRNNVSVMDLNSNTGALLHSALNLQSAAFNFGTGGSNNNDLFAPPANTQARVAVTGGSGGTFYATLADYQTAVAPQDANSVSVDPLFVSGTDLHIQAGSPVIGLASPLAAVTDDFDGQARDATTPDIGADEFAVGNTPPTITAVGIARQEGSPSSNSTIANVTDTESGNGAVIVTVISANPSNGVTISNIVNTDGVITADVIAACGASNASFTLQASDGTLTATDTLNVSVTPNTPPTLTYNNATVSSGGATMVNPATGPADNGAISTIAVQSAGTYTGTISVDNATGIVSISGAAPVGMHTITIRATDNCGIFTDATFTLDVQAASGGPVTVTATAGTPGPTDYPTLKDAVDAINAGTHQGDITVSIVTSTTETDTSVLNGSEAGPALYMSVSIRPTTDGVTVAGPSIQGRGLIELNGADNVTIDGDNPNTAGTNRNLTIQNTAANTVNFTSVIRIAMNITTVNSADNNIFRNLNIIGSSTGANISTATATTGPQNTTFGIFSGPNATDATTAPNPITSVLTGVAAGATASNLIVSNNSVITAARAISINGSATSVHTGLQIRDNSIGNPVTAEVDQVTSIGITANGATNPVIADNTVYVEGFIRSSAATHGINVGVNSTNTIAATIERNKVNRVRNNDSTTWSAFGINIAGIAASAHTVRNNFVSGVINDQTAGTGGFGTTFGAYGIRIASGTNHQIYHNSVNLYGAMGGTTNTNLTAAFMIVGTGQTGVDVRNNIFSNQITGGNPASPGTRNVAIYLPSGATSAMNLTLNNNNYLVGSDANNRMAQRGTVFGTGEYTLADFDPADTANPLNFRNYSSTLSAAGTNDNASRKVDPQFVSNVDLHILATSQMESGGTDVGVADDIDGDVRPSVPDIGADEISVAGPGTIQFSSVSYSANEGTTATINVIRSGGLDGTVGATATITDGTATGGASCSPGVDYINPGPQVLSYGNGEGLKSFNIVTCTDATLKANETVILTLSSPTGGATIGANNPATLTIVDVPPPFSGTISVGTGELFTSLTNPGGIFQAINEAGLSANLTINITSDLTGETGAVALNQFAEFGAGGYTLTFKPSGAPRTISGTAPANIGLINLNGVDRVTIDGSLSGGTDRSLTITNSQTGTSAVIWLRSASAANGANNNTIKNTILFGATAGTAQTTAGLLAGSGTTIGGPAEAPNNNNTVMNNHIYGVQNSIYNQGNTGFDQNWLITGNEFGSTVEANKNRFRGMLMGNAQNFVISNNTINGVLASPTTTAAMSGIQLAFTLNGGSIVNNTISDIKNNSTSGTGSFGMQLTSTTAAANVLIANNFIYDVAAVGSATLPNNGHGINFNGVGAGGYRIYHNSVNVNTNQGSGTTSAMLVRAAGTGGLDIRNNIFANTQTAGATRYAFYSEAAASVYSSINFNDYFSTGSVGFLGGARATLAEWQTATGQDANSVAVDPLFVSATDLHLQSGSPMINAGTPVVEVTTDIDGDPRSATTPDIGADEFSTVGQPGSLQFSSATYSVGEGDGTVTLTVTRTSGTTGAVTADYTLGGGTATGGASCGGSVDYVNTGGTVSFADGETSKTFNVTICDDASIEGNETFNATLSNPTGGATIGTPNPATVTIVDNDLPSGTFSVNDVRIFEGNAGTSNAVFTVTYTGTGPGSVNFATSNGTATASVDYFASNGSLNFASAGTQTISVVVVGDTVIEANETFFLTLSGAFNGTITDGQGVGIIIDDDRAYVSDFDNDKISDYSVYRPSTGDWYALRSSNGVPYIVNLGIAGDIAVPGDYDGDGYTDRAIFRPSEGTWYVVLATTEVLVVQAWGSSGDIPVQGDYDGDGKTDYGVFRPSEGRWYILGSSSGQAVYQFGLAGDIPVVGDFDGDAKTDVTIYRDGFWYILRSSDQTVSITKWGNATDVPVSGDFDGDGSFDHAIYRDGQWWILSSLTGQSHVVNLGVATDIPALADYDGDGTTDVTVFRPSTGEWFTYRSSDNVLSGPNWGTIGDVPVATAYTP